MRKSNRLKKPFVVVVVCALAIVFGPRIYRWARFTVEMEDLYPEGTPRMRMVRDDWTGEGVFRRWFRSGVLRTESIEEGDGETKSVREWFDLAPSDPNMPRLRSEETYGAAATDSRRVVWNYDGSIDPDLSVSPVQRVRTRVSAVGQLRRQRQPISASDESTTKLVALLRSTEPIQREQASRTLGYLRDGNASRSIGALLADPDQYVALAAAESLGEIGPPAAEAVDLLVAYMVQRLTADSRLDDACSVATEALGRIGTREALNGLLTCISSPACGCNLDSVFVVSDCDGSEAAVGTLVAACSDPWLAGSAICELGELGAKAERAVPHLVGMLAQMSSDDFRRGTVIEALGAIGPSARAAVPTLVSIAKSEPTMTGDETRAMSALATIGTTDAATLDFLFARLREGGPRWLRSEDLGFELTGEGTGRSERLRVGGKPWLWTPELERAIAAGGNSAIDRVKPLLDDPEFAGVAARILRRMASPRAEEIIRAAIADRTLREPISLGLALLELGDDENE